MKDKSQPIWNPWHGCVKISEGCENCYMYFLDRQRGADGRRIYRTGAGFYYPLQRTRSGEYKVRSGELVRVCMTSDFFLEEADQWRDEAWRVMRARSDVKFFLLTKRPERVADCLPHNWDDGWDNIFFNVTCENQRRADERIPILLELPFKHKGFMVAPFIGEVNVEQYLATGAIEQVIAGGENYDGARPCNFDWVKSLSAQCQRHDVRFCFIETGTNFIKDGRLYCMPDKKVQSEMAMKANVNYEGRPLQFILKNPFGVVIDGSRLYRPVYDGPCCSKCASRLICNGCSHCGRCK